MKLNGKVAVVTGGGRGIGEACANLISAEGARVTVVDLPGANAEATVKSICDHGRSALAVPADISSREQVERMVEQVVSEFGRIDILVNNAGVIRHVGLLETSDSDWDLMLRVNTTGTFLCTQAVANQMVKQGQGGRIINVTSMTAHMGVGVAAYSATKGAVDAFTRACAFELAPYGIRVNSVAPGHCDTPLNYGVNTPALIRAFNKRIALGRIARPQDVAAAVLFFALPESEYITGESLLVDGGNVKVGYMPLEYEEAAEKK
jgi:NAD(P)-dependent dehydrogenase (short-subunit alcohol dehydrogenase family)